MWKTCEVGSLGEKGWVRGGVLFNLLVVGSSLTSSEVGLFQGAYKFDVSRPLCLHLFKRKEKSLMLNKREGHR